MRIAALDAVRGAAAWAVAVPHYIMLSREAAPVAEQVSIVAVEVFFVLSGFVLAPQILYCAKAGAAKAIPVFFARRWMRTLPPYFCALVCIAAMTDSLFSWSFLAYATFTQNLLAIDPEREFFMPAWSLSVEEWFYLLFPPTFVLLTRRLRPVAAAALLAAVFLVIKVIGFYTFPDYALYVRRIVIFRLDAIAFGFLLFLAVSRFKLDGTSRRPLAAVLIVVSTCALLALAVRMQSSGAPALSLAYLYMAGAFAMSLLILALQLEPLLRRSPALVRLASFLGRISYDVYLFHMIFIAALQASGLSALPTALQIGLYAGLLTAFCAAFWRFVESPVLAARPKYPDFAE
jgi:peptidoglycan/LPS O-acetylase OafA/YrhL